MLLSWATPGKLYLPCPWHLVRHRGLGWSLQGALSFGGAQQAPWHCGTPHPWTDVPPPSPMEARRKAEAARCRLSPDTDGLGEAGPMLPTTYQGCLLTMYCLGWQYSTYGLCNHFPMGFPHFRSPGPAAWAAPCESDRGINLTLENIIRERHLFSTRELSTWMVSQSRSAWGHPNSPEQEEKHSPITCLNRSTGGCQLPAPLSELRIHSPKHVYTVLVGWYHGKMNIWPIDWQLLRFSVKEYLWNWWHKLPLEILIRLEITWIKLGLEIWICIFLKRALMYNSIPFTLSHRSGGISELQRVWVWAQCCCSRKVSFDFSKSCSEQFGIPGPHENSPHHHLLNHPAAKQRGSVSFFKLLRGWILVQVYSICLLKEIFHCCRRSFICWMYE